MPDLLDRVRQDIDDRLATLRPIVEEISRLEAARQALAGQGANPPKPAPTATSRTPKRSARQSSSRAPRGHNKTAILAVVDARPGVSVGEIAAVTQIAKATVASAVNKLKRDGLLEPAGNGVRIARPAESS